jgi:hypothetical protein
MNKWFASYQTGYCWGSLGNGAEGKSDRRFIGVITDKNGGLVAAPRWHHR